MAHTEENDAENTSAPVDPRLLRKQEKRTLQSVADTLRDLLRTHEAAREKGSGIVSPLIGMADRIAARADRGNGLGDA